MTFIEFATKYFDEGNYCHTESSRDLINQIQDNIDKGSKMIISLPRPIGKSLYHDMYKKYLELK